MNFMLELTFVNHISKRVLLVRKRNYNDAKVTIELMAGFIVWELVSIDILPDYINNILCIQGDKEVYNKIMNKITNGHEKRIQY